MKICLYFLSEPVLLLRTEGAAEYFNQVAFEEQRSMRGVLVPLAPYPELSARLRACIDPATEHVDATCADRLDGVFGGTPVLAGITVDRARLGQSVGGWVEVLVNSDFSFVDEIEEPVSGVITWTV